MIAVPMGRRPTASWTITGEVLRGWRRSAGVVHVAHGAIAAAAPHRAQRITLPEGWTLAPGFWDLQVNGFAGAEIGSDPAQLVRVAQALPSTGVTGFCPTLTSRSAAEYRRAELALRAARWSATGARSLGVHLEGPFLCPARSGAHRPGALDLPQPERVADLLGRFAPRIVTLAPELDGAIAAIAAIRRSGAIAAVGHTEADLACCQAAITAGARLLTHAFNAMPGVAAREPGPVGAFLTAPAAHIAVIADGVHVDDPVLALLVRAARRRLVAVSDASSAAGAAPGAYALAGRIIHSDGHTARDRRGRLAGSARPLSDAPATLHRAGASPAAALGAVTAAPRALLGAPDPLAPGAPADLVIVDAQLHPRVTVIGGRVAWHDRDLPFAIA